MSERSETILDSRERILHALASAPRGLTVEALTSVIGISRSGVRQHLIVLERDGLIARTAPRPSGGRPELRYVLTEDGHERFPRQYSWFAELLLQMISEQLSPDEVSHRLEQMGNSIGNSLTGPGGDVAPVAERVATVIERMNELGYDAKAIAGPDGWTIEASNCVFHKLAQKHREICRFDIAMLEAGTGRWIDHCACMARGDNLCRFRLAASVPKQV